jgi:alpha,alpha-trehalase
MIYGPQETLSAFGLVNVNNKTALEVFLNDYFLPAGSDLDSWVPADYTTTPDILTRITDTSFNSWASDLNNLWLVLGRQVNESVLEYPEKHSYLPRKYPMMVPGGRFRESYYWDSWFIIRGLLVCDMYDTALNVINNLLDDILNFGFVPNGGRIYYLDRSQPPVLSEMVLDYYIYMEGKFGLTASLEAFLIGAYSSLQTEYAWWMDSANGHTVDMGSGTVLNRYYSNYTTPRPESYAADYQNTSLPGISEAYALYYYHNKRAGAETGWDYSSRWLKGQYDIDAVATTEIIPVELNCILFKFEQNLAAIGTIVNVPDQSSPPLAQRRSVPGSSCPRGHIPSTAQLHGAGSSAQRGHSDVSVGRDSLPLVGL